MIGSDQFLPLKAGEEFRRVSRGTVSLLAQLLESGDMTVFGAALLQLVLEY